MRKNNITNTVVVLVVILICLPLAVANADDIPDFSGCPTDLNEAPEKFKKESDECMRSQDARHEAKLKADRAILAARFKAHPKLLKDPKLCDKLLVEKDKNSPDLFPWTQNSYYMMEACNDVTGATARMKRAHAADCASGNPNGPCAMGARMMEESKQKLDKDFDELRRSMHVEYSPCARDIANCHDDSIEHINDEYRREQEINSLRRQFQSEDEQRRIDEFQRKEEEEDEEDDEMLHHHHY